MGDGFELLEDQRFARAAGPGDEGDAPGRELLIERSGCKPCAGNKELVPIGFCTRVDRKAEPCADKCCSLVLHYLVLFCCVSDSNKALMASRCLRTR